MLLSLSLFGCHLFSSGEIEKTCDEIQGCGAPDSSRDSGDSGSITDCEDPSLWYTDADQDGYGAPLSEEEACDAPPGTVADNTDCDDGDRQSYPGAAEVWYDGVDQDCAGGDDDDADSDGYPQQEDCLDSDAAVHPEQEETCGDGVDSNCDGSSNSCALESKSLSESDSVLYGDTGSAYLAYAMALSGDVDGDGRDDLLVQAANEGNYSTGYGRIHLVTDLLSSGPLSSRSAASMRYPESDYTIGDVLASAGDINNDGFGDVAIGCVYCSLTEDYDVGLSFILTGPLSGEINLGDAPGILQGDTAYQHSGSALQSLGDQDGDSGDDLLIGEPNSSEYDGQVVLISSSLLLSGEGRTADLYSARLLGVEREMRSAGTSLSSGDLNGDGLADAAVGAPAIYNAGLGAAYVVEGPLPAGDTSLADADVIVSSNTAYYTGYRLSLEGDLDGDGYDDLLVAAPTASVYASYGGGVFAYYTPKPGSYTLGDADAQIHGAEEYDNIGFALDVGDTDADGMDDLALGAPYTSVVGVDRGAVFLVFGPLTGSEDINSADARFSGVSTSSHPGQVLALGHLNSDAYADLVVSAPYEDYAATDDGAIYTLLGQGL